MFNQNKNKKKKSIGQRLSSGVAKASGKAGYGLGRVADRPKVQKAAVGAVKGVRKVASVTPKPVKQKVGSGLKKVAKNPTAQRSAGKFIGGATRGAVKTQINKRKKKV